MSNTKNMKKNFLWNTIGTTLNAFNSLFFLIIVTRINGVKDAGIFSFGFAMACLFFIIGIYSGRVFQVTDQDKENDDYSYINMHIITFFIMLFLAFMFCIIRGYGSYKFIVIMLLILYKGLEAVSDTFYAIIQKKNNLYKVGISLFVKSILGVLSFVVIDLLTNNLILSILGIVLVNLIFLVSYDIRQSKIDFSKGLKYNNKKVIKLFKIGLFTFLFTFLNLYLVNTSKYIIDFTMHDKFQTIFGIIIMPATVISLFAQFIIHPFLLHIKEYISVKDYKNLKTIMVKLSSAIFFFGILSILIAWFIGIPVLNLIYGIDLTKYKVDLIIILIGGIFYALIAVFSNVLIAFRKTLSQLIVYVLVAIGSTVLTALLVSKLSMLGASLSYAITMFVVCVAFIIINTYVIRVKNKELK